VGVWSAGLVDTFQTKTQRLLNQYSQQNLSKPFAENGQALQAPHCCLSMLTLHMLLPPNTSHSCCCLQAIQPGALVVHSNGGEPQAMQMVASPKIATSQAQSTSSMTPQAAQEAHALANASETLKAQAQTLKVCVMSQQRAATPICHGIVSL